MTYTEIAHANGAWSARVLLPATPFETVCGLLKDLTAHTGMPITAFQFGGDGDPVDELLLVRDPSRTHGTPEVREYETLATRLTAETGWPVASAHSPRDGILVGLGLREGFEPGAPQHSLTEVEQHLAERGTCWRCRAARLVSARLVGGDVQWYDEVGAVVEAPAEMTPVIEQMAGTFRQDRFVVTNFSNGWTRALATT
ncbi:hypothetical protein [Amycolatopsis sp. GM8]|uniref:hypothetical protein n=1 Tax=Amycolatopsis sp. GM8 TaxID=2896530 RepID=UPI001F1F7CBE|nr:hypothetical protein [Amycolatopsis sp. GM8]